MNNRLGVRVKKEVIVAPTKVERIRNPIKKMSCGLTHSAVLDTQGVMFTFGNNLYGALGRKVDGTASFDCNAKAIKLPRSEKISFINCGDYSCGGVTERGNVFLFGLLCGNNLTSNQYTPRFVEDANIWGNEVHIGYSHILFLADKKLTFCSEEMKKSVLSKLKYNIDPSLLKEVSVKQFHIIQEKFQKSILGVKLDNPAVSLDKSYINFSSKISTASKVLNITNLYPKKIHLRVQPPTDLPKGYSLYTPNDITIDGVRNNNLKNILIVYFIFHLFFHFD